jgi:hypothetical protein
MTANTPRGFTYPLYTDPVSITQSVFADLAGDLDTAVEQLDNRIQAAYQRPAARASGLANQNFPPTTNVTVTFSAEDFDIGNMIDIPTNNTRIRITEQGFYLVGASIAVTPIAGNWALQASILNSATTPIGATSLRGNDSGGATPANTYMNVHMLTFCDGITPADITVVVRQASIGAVQIQDRNLWATKIGNVAGGF